MWEPAGGTMVKVVESHMANDDSSLRLCLKTTWGTCAFMPKIPGENGERTEAQPSPTPPQGRG